MAFLNERYGITQEFGANPPLYKPLGYSGHPGIDFGAPSGSDVYCEEAGTVELVRLNSPTAGNYVGVRGNSGVLWRYLHNRAGGIRVSAGQKVGRGFILAKSGNTGLTTGPHIHVDTAPRIPNPNNGYGGRVNPRNYRPGDTPTPPPPSKMPNIGQVINITKGYTRNTYRAGTTIVAGSIHATDTTYNYLVRGYDPIYPNRILINSTSGGGNGVALALYYTSGAKIDGWTIK